MRSTSTLALTVIMLGLQLRGLSQNDSTHLDAGSIVFKRDFTQNIRISGEDLEQIPFADLTDAIQPWLYAAYTSRQTLLYVVDGVVTNNVNAYSVFDIEEVVLVQQAAGPLNTAGSQQQLVLITTRKRVHTPGKGKLGFTGGAQTGLVNQAYSNYEFTKGEKSTTNMYHQYYGTVYSQTDKTAFGVSASYLRDVDPSMTFSNPRASTPSHYDRWRFAGYFSARLGRKHHLDVHADFVPEPMGNKSYPDASPYAYNSETSGSTKLWLPWARLHSELLPGLTNDLQAGYLNGTSSWVTSQTKVDTTGAVSSGIPIAYRYTNKIHQDRIYVRDRIAYAIPAGAWRIEPSLNASYEHYAYRNESTQTRIIQTPFGIPGTALNTSASWDKQTQYFLTPALDLTLSNFFNIQTGVRADISGYHGRKPLHRVFPFASMSLDLLRINDPVSRKRLQIFGSWARRAGAAYPDFSLPDVNSDQDQPTAVSPAGYVYGAGLSLPPMGSPVPPPSSFWIWETGARYATAHERISLSYNFERRNFIGVALTPVIIGTGTGMAYVFPEFKSSQHHAGIDVKIVEEGHLRWQTGIHWTSLHSIVTTPAGTLYMRPVGGWNDHGGDWTTGWVNGVAYKGLMAGADLLYRHGQTRVPDSQEDLYGWDTQPVQKINSFQLQHLFVGYRFRLSKAQPLEVYLNSRSLYQSSHSTLSDRRRYYGMGAKLTI